MLARMQASADIALATAAITTPMWVQYAQTALGLVMALGGAVLLGMRLYLSWREIRSKKKQSE